MVKKLHFVLLLCAFHCAVNPILAANDGAWSENNTFNVDECNAPPPNNFQITSVGGDFISLSWQPAWVGAIHTLEVLEKNGSGVWTPFSIHNNVIETSFTVPNLKPGFEYRFIIATNCTTGEPSAMKAIKDGIALILELTITGRTPVNPMAVDCHHIAYKNYNWVGFQVETVSKFGVHTSNLFEFEPIDDGILNNGILSKGRIKRVTYDDPIVATDEEGFWPDYIFNSLPGNDPFRMARINEDGINSKTIGRVLLTGYPTSIDLCADFLNQNDPWDNKYTFTALASQTASGILHPYEDERSAKEVMFFEKVWANSPFNDILNVFIPKLGSKDNETNVRLLDINGQLKMERYFDVADSQVSFNVGELLPGIYIIHIESGRMIQTLKVIKLD